MGAGNFILSMLFIILVALLLIMYWFVPYRDIQLETVPEHYKGTSNFSVDEFGNQDMQFYPNMRYPVPNISYKVYDCPLQKRNDAEKAFEIIAEETVLDFYPVQQDEMVGIYCSQKRKTAEEFFVAGEGGPVEIIRTKNFNVIFRGEVLLYEESRCTNPNVAIHEIFHVLGFKHSDNPNSIMYNITKCEQTIGDDIINTINDIYSVPTQPDLQIRNASASIEGRYLSTNLTVMNNGLKNSEAFNIVISTENEIIKEIPVEPLEIGNGRTLFWENILIKDRNYEYLEYEINSSEQELDKKNNKIKLEIKE